MSELVPEPRIIGTFDVSSFRQPENSCHSWEGVLGTGWRELPHLSGHHDGKIVNLVLYDISCEE